VLDRRTRLLLLAVLAVAAGVRTAWVLALDVDPRRDFHLDMTWYDLAALRLLDGALLRGADGVPTAFWPPGYPALLASAYALLGPELWVAKALNVALAVATCACVFGLAARLFGPRVGLAAAAILALLPDHVLYAPLLLSESAFMALWAALFWLLARWGASDPRSLRWIGFGALAGAATLVRGTGALFLAVPFAAWWWAERRPGPALARTLRACAGMLAVIAPWTLRNALVMGAPIAVASSVGMSFLYTHNPHAEGSATLRHAHYRSELLLPLRELPQPEREVAEMRAGLREGLAFILAHPGRELALVPQRWRELFRHGHAGLDWSRPRRAPGTRAPEAGAPPRALLGERADVAVERVADLTFYALLLFAALGVPGALAQGSAAAKALPLAVAYLLFFHGVILYGEPRYHAPLLPVLAVLAARGLASLRRARPAPLAAATALASAALAGLGCDAPAPRKGVADACREALAPLDAGFGARGPHAVTRERLDDPARPELPVWLYLPEPAGAPVPVVLFAHAWDTGDPELYRGLLEHVASRGYAVVFPQYPAGESPHAPRYEILWQGLLAAAEQRGERLDLSRLGVVGHSYGAGAAPWLLLRARRERGWGERGAFLHLLAPWYPLALSAEELAGYPADVKVLIQVFEGDTATDPRIAIDLFRALGVDEKDYLRVPALARGECRLPAPHTVPQSRGLAAADDALDERALFRLFDALAAYSFAGDAAGRAVALGRGAPEQVGMGSWRDGAPLPALVWSAAPEPAQPEERYIFRASQRAEWERYGQVPAGGASAPTPTRR
jgi:4-amino-4-deoxy-L-arabinose transferase-like glycosyltransferase